jgi:hypothetical protein
MDTKSVQGTRDSHPCEAGEEPEGVEGKVGQDLQPCVSHRGMQPKARFSGLPEGCCRPRQARRGQLLAAQVPCDIRNAVSLGRGGPKDRAAVAGPLGYGIDHAVLEAVAESGGQGEGERDFRVNHVLLRRSESVVETSATSLAMRSMSVMAIFRQQFSGDSRLGK